MRPRTAFLLPLALLLAACGSGDGTATGPTSEAAPTAVAEPVVEDDLVADAPLLTPDATLTLDDADSLQQIALSPDGASLAASFQSGLGEPVTLRVIDVATGEVGAEVAVDVLRFGFLQWLADGRLIAATGESFGDSWRTWDGSTLTEGEPAPLDYDCGEGQVDVTTGVVYSTPDDGLCRVDTADGTTSRSPEVSVAYGGALWVRAGANEVVAVLETMSADGSTELVVLDGTTWEEKSSTTVPAGTSVPAVGATTVWFDTREPPGAVLEPGAIPVPVIRDPISVSAAGTIFLAPIDGASLVFISASDGSVLGTIADELNLTSYAAWSADDGSFARATMERQVEVYRF